jgi:hypothetical protein
LIERLDWNDFKARGVAACSRNRDAGKDGQVVLAHCIQPNTIRHWNSMREGIKMAAEKRAASPAASLTNAPGAFGIAPERLADIAVEVERLCGVVRAAAPQLDFNDEPSAFAATLNDKAR